MSVHLDRARLLMAQERFDLAEKELTQALGADPDDALAHALFGLCLARRKEFHQATQEARWAIRAAPDLPFAHYVLALIFHDRDRPEEAERAIEEAIRLDPEDADYRALLANIRYVQRRWDASLQAAEEGLALNPEHTECLNTRAMALVKLGRRQEAEEVIADALAQEPDNAFSHANQGWALLEKGDHRKALEHFREALRLNPNLEWARQGIVEALKARYLIYRLMLWYFLWMSKLGVKAQWALVIGGFLGFRALRGVAKSNPDLAPFIWPVLGLYMAFALLTWLADPLFNLLLRLNRFGRLALSRDQIVASNWVGGCLVGGLAAAAAWLVTGVGVLLLGVVFFGLLIIPIAGTFKCQPGWPRTAMGAYTALLAGWGLAGLALLFVVPLLALVCLGLFLLGAILSEWVANGLIMIRPKH